MKQVIILGLLISFLALQSQAQNQESISTQDTVSTEIQYDEVSIGLGFGLNYGGIGANLLFYPQQNLGLFLGLGYAFSGIGINAGLKARLVSKKQFNGANPFIIGMYGYNSTIVVENAPELNKFFYGPSVGFGLDFGPIKKSKGYFSFAVLIPIRSQDVFDYMEDLEKQYGVNFGGGLLPFAISLGYSFAL
jgi:hypothetical protein